VTFRLNQYLTDDNKIW